MITLTDNSFDTWYKPSLMMKYFQFDNFVWFSILIMLLTWNLTEKKVSPFYSTYWQSKVIYKALFVLYFYNHTHNVSSSVCLIIKSILWSTMFIYKSDISQTMNTSLIYILWNFVSLVVYITFICLRTIIRLPDTIRQKDIHTEATLS